MPGQVTISQSDLKINIVILNLFNRDHSGPLAVAATRLIQLWATQLTEQSRRELSVSGVSLEGY